jgi:hypothetical protein
MDPTTLRSYIESYCSRCDQARQYEEQESQAQRDLDYYQLQAAQAEYEANMVRQDKNPQTNSEPYFSYLHLTKILRDFYTRNIIIVM